MCDMQKGKRVQLMLNRKSKILFMRDSDWGLVNQKSLSCVKFSFSRDQINLYLHIVFLRNNTLKVSNPFIYLKVNFLN